MIGRHIVGSLLRAGYKVRVLSRQPPNIDSQAVIFQGDLRDDSILARFLSGADLVFHCAAELRDESIMWDVNVNGTNSVLKLCKAETIKYFCYLSSAGVVGKTQESLVSEHTDCHPQDAYERSKWEAEQLVREGIAGTSVVILRPTNVVDEERPGALILGKDKGLKNRLKVVLKGAECSHLVHSEDVARTATYFIDSHFEDPECFIVSCDHEPSNTFAGIWALYQSVTSGSASLRHELPIHLPLYIPYLVRRLVRGSGNLGDVRYSSAKLLKHGFTFKYELRGILENMIS